MKSRSLLLLTAALFAAFTFLCSCSSSDECSESDTDASCPDLNCPEAGPPAPSNDTGNVCAYHEHCADFCIMGLSGMAPYCTRGCETAACPAGYSCLSVGQYGMICVMGACASDNDCPSRYECNQDDADNPVCRHVDMGCQTDEDCPAATACNQGLCQLHCENDDDCKQGYHCEWHRRCVLCTSDGQCTGGYSCEDGNCNEACIQDDDCRTGYECTGPGCDPIVGGGPGGLDAGCEEHSDCEDFCRYEYCGKTCEGEGDTESCPEGYYCHPGSLVCDRE